MLPALAAATTAIDALQALTAAKKKTATNSGAAQPAPNPFDVPSATTASTATATGSTNSSYKLAPGTMATLLDAQSQPVTADAAAKRSESLNRLLGLLDKDGSGGISKAEFVDKLGAGGTNTANADKVFDKLDKDGDGSVTQSELSAALKGSDAASKAASALQGGGGGGDDSDGATSTTTMNADGTTTTSTTYADGSVVSMTSAPTASSAATSTSASAKASSSYNSIEQMIQRQAQAIQAGKVSSTVSISA